MPCLYIKQSNDQTTMDEQQRQAKIDEMVEKVKVLDETIKKADLFPIDLQIALRNQQYIRDMLLRMGAQAHKLI